MKRRWIAVATGLAAMAPVVGAGGRARADSRVSLDLTAMMVSVPAEVADWPPPSTEDGRRLVYAVVGDPAVVERSSVDAALGVEVRPSFAFASGLRLAMGFRWARAVTLGGEGGPVDGRGPAQVWGGDVAVGYQRPFGRFLPWADLRFGFNDWELPRPGALTVHHDELRVSAVLGARCYLSPSVYLAASVFGGLGDRIGGTVGLGFDVVRYRYRGVLP